LLLLSRCGYSQHSLPFCKCFVLENQLYGHHGCLRRPLCQVQSEVSHLLGTAHILMSMCPVKKLHEPLWSQVTFFRSKTPCWLGKQSGPSTCQLHHSSPHDPGFLGLSQCTLGNFGNDLHIGNITPSCTPSYGSFFKVASPFDDFNF
jgi:hypothetical protein